MKNISHIQDRISGQNPNKVIPGYPRIAYDMAIRGFTSVMYTINSISWPASFRIGTGTLVSHSLAANHPKASLELITSLLKLFINMHSSD